MEQSVGVQVPLYPRSFTTDRKVTTLQVTITPVTDVQQEAEHGSSVLVIESLQIEGPSHPFTVKTP